MPEPGRRTALPSAAALGTAVAYLAFAATFRGPRHRFWQRMTRTALGLGGLAAAARPELLREPWTRQRLLLGGAIAAGLYGVFTAGDRVTRRLLPGGDRQIADIYQLRQLRPRPELALRLALVIAPAEELFWRGVLQPALAERYGRWRGAGLAALLYGGAHLCTGNVTLVGAASVAGGAWSGLAAAGTPMPALVASHAAWDVWIFLLQPTQR